MKEEMKALYVEGFASHDGHPHAGATATPRPKRWAVVRVGAVSSLETSYGMPPLCL